MTRLAQLVSRLMRGQASIAVGMGIMSVATYGFTMVAARVLGPKSYGAFAGLMATLLVISVLQLGLQATAARRISTDPEHVAQIEHSIMRVTIRASLALGLLLLVLSPLINIILRLDSVATAALVAVAAVPLTLMGGQAGILQGERRWWPLSAMYMASGVPRLIVGTAMIVWQPSELGAMIGVVIGAFAPVVLGWYALRIGRPEGRVSDTHSAGPVIRETIHNSQALLAFFALSNADVIVARNVLDSHDAGLYAGGLIFTKAVLFLPQFVVVIAFPSMSTAQERRRALTRGLSLVAFLGVCCTVGAALLPGLTLAFFGGDKYAEVESLLWLFALLGTLLAMLQLLVYAVLARQGLRSVYLVWAALVALVVGAYAASTLEAVLTVVLIVDAVLFVALLVVSLYLVREPVDEPVTEPGSEPAERQ